ncbi:MAG: DUF5681 domain-containing protein [Rhodospirillales bacterium]
MKGPKIKPLNAQTAALYDVGYGRPPEETRFKPGRSGNPRGRPRGSRNKKPALNEERLKEIILEEAYRRITVRDGHRNVSVPMAQAIVRSMAVNAVKGQHRAQRLFAEMLSSTERQNKALVDEWFCAALDYKIEWERELHRREMLAITGLPDPLPHPDQVKIDMDTGMARIEGPATKEALAEVARWREKQEDFQKELEWIEAELKRARKPERIALLEADKKQVKRVLETISTALGMLDWKR